MGRRPNSVVVEFFERGAKLENNSNRYAHTCKRCGEEFPKGRIDTLTTHLLRRCSNLSQDDRDWVQQQLLLGAERSQRPKSKPPVQPEVQPELLSSVYQQSALDTLAEVSRHHLDYSTHRHPNELLQQYIVDPTPNVTAPSAEQTILAHLQEFTGPHSSSAEEAFHIEDDSTASAVPQQPSSPSHSKQALLTASADPNLVHTASAANQQLEAGQHNGVEQDHRQAVVDPELHSMETLPPPNLASAGLVNTSWRRLEPQLLPDPNAFITVTPTAQKPTPKKVRGQFGATRRKEVANIRKNGACIRCRMLKKSCSGETPCSTCKNVETARLWKGGCLRARIADEFTLYAAKLFYQRASIEVGAAVHGLEQTPISGTIRVRCPIALDSCIAFCVSAAGAQANLPNILHASIRPSDRTLLMIHEQSEALMEKLEAYVDSVSDPLIRSERTHFLQMTLQRAQQLSRREEDEHAAKDNAQSPQSTRSCYSVQRPLVKNSLALWVLTDLLLKTEKHALQIEYHHQEQPRQEPGRAAWSADNGEDPRLLPSDSPSYRLIGAQILAAIEDRCASLSRTIMNELEHRLLQRQHGSRFATLLAAVILLNCVERMTSLYHSFDDGNKDVDNARGQSEADNTIAPKNWSLETSPSALWQQGPRFADLLTMLLRLRGLPPKTQQSPDGMLSVMQDCSSPGQGPVRPMQEQTSEQNRVAAAWLDPLNLSIGDLVAKRDGPTPGKDTGVEAWDMRFIAKVLLPENV